DDASITDDAQELLVTGPNGDQAVTLNGAPTKVQGVNQTVYRYTVLTVDPSKIFTQQGTNWGVLTVSFLPNTWTDSRGGANAAAMEHFTVFDGSNNGQAPTPAAYGALTTPFNGATMSASQINAKGYIDVTFVVPNGGTLDTSSISKDDIQITGT